MLKSLVFIAIALSPILSLASTCQDLGHPFNDNDTLGGELRTYTLESTDATSVAGTVFQAFTNLSKKSFEVMQPASIQLDPSGTLFAKWGYEEIRVCRQSSGKFVLNILTSSRGANEKSNSAQSSLYRALEVLKLEQNTSNIQKSTSSSAETIEVIDQENDIVVTKTLSGSLGDGLEHHRYVWSIR